MNNTDNLKKIGKTNASNPMEQNLNKADKGKHTSIPRYV